jgi:hypothetical protein
MPSISDFKNALVGGGARPSLFFCQISFPAMVDGSLATQKAVFLVKATSLPGSTLNVVKTSFQGREIKLAGQRTFEEPWKVTFYNDTDFSIRNAVESWVQIIQDAGSSVGLAYAEDYQVDMQVFQLDRTGAPIKQYTFYDAWPSAIGEIELASEAEQAIESFDCSFEYNYFDTPETFAMPLIPEAVLSFIATVAL